MNQNQEKSYHRREQFKGLDIFLKSRLLASEAINFSSYFLVVTAFPNNPFSLLPKGSTAPQKLLESGVKNQEISYNNDMFNYSEQSKEKAQKILEGIAEKAPRKIKLPKSLAVVDQAQCTGCEACIQFCPVDCIEIVPGPEFPDTYQLVEIDLDRCIGCKLCVKYCPWDTIYMIPSAEAYDQANDWTLNTVVKLDRSSQEKILWAAEEEPETTDDEPDKAQTA